MQTGTTLTEVLVALLIFSLTTVTATAMILESLRSLSNAINQQHAARLASNLQAIITDLPLEILRLPATTSPANPPANEASCDAETQCTPAIWLATEIRRLQEQAENSLPDGRIELTEAPSGMDIQVSWASHISNQRLTYALHYNTT